ncbi:ribosome-inactivating family protein [Streptomyces laurentii]|uniref:ribosome-inactivating family protein n=1 Tax=Streptomyces laurentii TaxID=39478 RepID=UPI0036773DAD
MRGAAGITVLALAAALLGSAPAAAATTTTTTTTTTERPAQASVSIPAAAAAADPPDLTQPADFANAVQRLIFRTRHDFTDETPVGTAGFTHMLVGRGTTGERNWGVIKVGHLAYRDESDLQLVVDPDDLYIRGFYRRSNNTLYRFRGTDIPDGLFPGATPVEFNFTVNYRDLAGITINREAITDAVDDLLNSPNLNTGGPLQNALEIMAVTFAETARNRMINREVYNALRQGGGWLVGAHAPAMTRWDAMGQEVRNALTDGNWTIERGSFLLDGVHGGQPRAYNATYLRDLLAIIKRR